MGKYKMTRTSLQFDKKFIEFLDNLLKGTDIAKNQYIMKCCGYTGNIKQLDEIMNMFDVSKEKSNEIMNIITEK